MKKLFALLVTLLLLAGCGENIKGGDWEAIQKRGYIVVAMEGAWEPWTYHDAETNELVGYDVEVGKYIADYLGLEARFVEGAWDGLLAGVDGGRYDMMINGCDITDERQAAYDFSTPYARDIIVVITRSDDDRITTMEDLNGMDTANTISSTYAKIAEQYGAKVKGIDDLNDTFLELESKRIDATLNSEPSYEGYMASNPDAQFKIACYYDFDKNPYVGIAMKKGSSALVEKVNEAIEAAKADGTLTKLSIKYFGKDVNNQ